MQRYSGGLQVPKFQTDFFTGKTTDAAGAFTVDLKYTPKSINDIVLAAGGDAAVGDPRIYAKISLTGKALQLSAIKLQYDKPNATTGGAEGSTGGGAHTHSISTTTTDILKAAAATELQGTVTVIYRVAF